MPGKLLNIKQVMEMLDTSERTLFRIIKHGELTGFKVGREWRFDEEDITAFIARQREKAREQVEKDA